MVSRLATAQSTAAIGHWPAAIVMLATVAALTAPTADALAAQARPVPPVETAPRAAAEPIMVAAAARWLALAALIVTSASCAALARTSVSSSVPRTGVIPSLASAAVVSSERARPLT